MKRTKTDYLLFSFALILVGVVFGVVYFAFRPGPDKQSIQATPTPTIGQSKPLPDEEVQTKPAISYDDNGEEKLQEILSTRPPLSDEDILAKSRILTLLEEGEVSGVVYASSTIIIEYVQSANVFMVEIRTTDIIAAKKEAVAWFTTQGMSQDGICKAPVEFYLNTDIAEQLRGTNTTISTLAPGC